MSTKPGPGAPRQPSKAESKTEATDKAARDSLDRDAAAVAIKTERLKAARLARDAAEPVVVKKPAAKKKPKG